MEFIYKPQINLARSTAGQMWLLSLCAGAVILQSSLTDSFSSLIIALSAVVAAVASEFFIYFRTERSGSVKDGSAITSALILTLLLPHHIHPVYAVAGAVFAMTVIKHSFGGLGSNWLNPAVGGWLFVRFSWPDIVNNALSGSSIPDALSTVTPFAENISDFLNRTIFTSLGTAVPGWYIDLFHASNAGIIADRGVFALLIGTIVITAFSTSRTWVPAVYLVLYCSLLRLFGAIPEGGLFGQGDMVQGLFSGGTLVAAFILASDPSTKPKSSIGILIIAMLAGVLSFLFRYVGGDLYGAFTAIALANVLTLIVRDIEIQLLKKDQKGAFLSVINYTRT
jgi:electron transport complex protein RnfD